ncbi:hypothetical protein Aduo_007887 [Ancylostoma duodenale]
MANAVAKLEKKQAEEQRRLAKSRETSPCGLIALVGIDCLLGIVTCIYDITNQFHVQHANIFFRWLDKNVTLVLFITMSINSYGIIFLSVDLRLEAIAPILKKLKYKQPSTVTTTVIVRSIGAVRKLSTQHVK